LLTIRYVGERIRYEVIKYVNSVQQSNNGHSDTEESEHDEEKERELSSSDDEHQASGDSSSDKGSDVGLSSKEKKKPTKRPVDSKRDVSNKRIKASGKSGKAVAPAPVAQKKAKSVPSLPPAAKGKHAKENSAGKQKRARSRVEESQIVDDSVC
jgi:hypothetical protein